jgi:hypothetical protein
MRAGLDLDGGHAPHEGLRVLIEGKSYRSKDQVEI